MPEWIADQGIGETRYALVDGDDILEARIELEGVVPAGSIVGSRLTALRPRPIATDQEGNEYLLSRAPAGVTEGQSIEIDVTRSRIPGAEPWKRPLARQARDRTAIEATPAAKGGALPASWDDLIEEARSGIVRFDGGELRISPTPAMTLIDVDGYLDAADLAVRGAGEAAKAIRRLDIGGSIGIDLPTSGSKSARVEAAAEVDSILPQPFERTAVNGFGFLQVVRPRRRASIVELAQDRASFEARDLLRRLKDEEPGAKRIVAHPSLVAVLQDHPDWLEALARQVGGAVSLRADPAVTISGAYAEQA